MTVLSSTSPKDETAPASPDDERFLKTSVSSLKELRRLVRENKGRAKVFLGR